jgi:hypothetical protein
VIEMLKTLAPGQVVNIEGINCVVNESSMRYERIVREMQNEEGVVVMIATMPGRVVLNLTCSIWEEGILEATQPTPLAQELRRRFSLE